MNVVAHLVEGASSQYEREFESRRDPSQKHGAAKKQVDSFKNFITKDLGYSGTKNVQNFVSNYFVRNQTNTNITRNVLSRKALLT